MSTFFDCDTTDSKDVTKLRQTLLKISVETEDINRD